ncbi:hypothetical protein KKC45_03670 [Patescibacteria group bacterium]|nr:hypothetical protein [Patescibacteria group bacterium]
MKDLIVDLIIDEIYSAHVISISLTFWIPIAISLLALGVTFFFYRRNDRSLKESNKIARLALDRADLEIKQGEFRRNVVQLVLDFIESLNKEYRALDNLSQKAFSTVREKNEKKEDWHILRRETGNKLLFLKKIIKNIANVKKLRETQIRNFEEHYLHSNDLSFNIEARNRFLDTVDEDFQNIIKEAIIMGLNLVLVVDSEDDRISEVLD